MNKKWKVALSIMALSSTLVACSPKEEATVHDGIKEVQKHKHVAYKEVSDRDVPSKLRGGRGEGMAERGYMYQNKGGNMYAYISMGSKPTGGHRLKVTAVERKGNTTTVFIKETAPSKDMMVTQMISHPKLLLKIEGTTQHLKVVTRSNGMVGKELECLKP